MESPGCKAGVEIPIQRRPKTCPKVAQLVSSELIGRLSQHLLNCCRNIVREKTDRQTDAGENRTPATAIVGKEELGSDW